MNIEEFQTACSNNQPSFEQCLVIEKRMSKVALLLHAQLGITSEAGEFADALKKHCIYGKPLDGNNIVEELGDLLWYISLACDSMEITMNEVMEMNVNKLKIRYPERFNEADAVERKDKICPYCGCTPCSNLVGCSE